MKNHKSKLKLSLNRETLVSLEPHQMAEVNGGIIWTVVPIAVAATLLICSPQQAR